ncbi:hypothetical protein RJ640_008390, partial [Escallonia rubra]
QTKQEPRKEEFSDWPHGLLTIGTFGNNDFKENPESQNLDEEQPCSPDLADFTPEEVGKLQKELTKLLSRKPAAAPKVEGDIADLPLDKFLNCPSSLEVDRRLSNTLCIMIDFQLGDWLQLLRAMLSKKIHPQNSSRASSTRRYIEDRQKPQTQKGKEEERGEKANNGCKWVKTDSEYIVLEI